MRKILVTLAALALVSCDGPWNMGVDDTTPPLKLHVGAFLVAGQPFDTIWLDRLTPLAATYDSTLGFVDTSRSQMGIVELGQIGGQWVPVGDTIKYRPSPGNTRAWISVRPTDSVRFGKRYGFAAAIRWNASRTWPSGQEWKLDTLLATTRTPSSYRIGDSILAPVEALNPTLARGLTEAERQFAVSAPDSFRAMLEKQSPGLGLAAGELSRLLDGRSVYRSIASGDSVWFVSNVGDVFNDKGETVKGQYRQYRFSQKYDPTHFGGMLFTQSFDTSGSRIISTVEKQINDAIGKKTIDSVRDYQRGGTRTGILYGAYAPDTKYYPDTLVISNIYIGYTGRNVFRFFGLDTLYPIYYQGIAPGNGTNILKFSNIFNGDGYFSGVGQDSVVLHVKAPAGIQTYPVRELRKAWCRDQKKKAEKDHRTFKPGAECSDI